MTFDERLDRLTERHEALAQSVEILLAVSREHGQQITDLSEACVSLLQIAQIHEARIGRLEDEDGGNGLTQ